MYCHEPAAPAAAALSEMTYECTCRCTNRGAEEVCISGSLHAWLSMCASAEHPSRFSRCKGSAHFSELASWRVDFQVVGRAPSLARIWCPKSLEISELRSTM